MKNTKKLVIAAMMCAVGIVLPMAFHAVPDAGRVFLPMHIPVLLCGMLTCPVYGVACGLVTPALSSLLTSMPNAATLPSMLVELAVYGLVAGLVSRLSGKKSVAIRSYASLVFAMLAGRVVKGVLSALIFNAGSYSLQAWLTASFVTALPGIVIQLVAIPLLAIALEKTGLVESPCSSTSGS